MKTTTRCYEYYTMFCKDPERCAIKSKTAEFYVKDYMEFMKEKGVKFDGDPDDKVRFYLTAKIHGSERKVTQVQHVEQDSRTISFHVGTEEFEALKDIKGKRSWHDFFWGLAIDYEPRMRQKMLKGVELPVDDRTVSASLEDFA